MPVWLAETVLAIATAYAAVGVALGLAFLLFGLDRIEPGARGAYAFRPLLLPGLALLWPWVLLRWAGRGAAAGPARAAQRRQHLVAWGVLAVLLPLIGAGAVALRAGQPAELPMRLGP